MFVVTVVMFVLTMFYSYIGTLDEVSRDGLFLGPVRLPGAAAPPAELLVAPAVEHRT